MNLTFSTEGRNILKVLLSECTPPQQRMFKLMYARAGGLRSLENAEKMSIEEAVNSMDDDKISGAIDQCERTVAKNNTKQK